MNRHAIYVYGGVEGRGHIIFPRYYMEVISFTLRPSYIQLNCPWYRKNEMNCIHTRYIILTYISCEKKLSLFKDRWEFQTDITILHIFYFLTL
jgi:hypothetical protein